MEQIEKKGELLLLDKPLQWTSFDVVKKVRGFTKEKKVGHAGTLDPLATGLLLICTGRMTKTIPVLQDAEKEYTGTITLGIETASFDLETEVEQRWDVAHITPEMIHAAVEKLTGEIDQVPPMHSAIKLNGKRAYELARKGETAELKSRKITIRTFEITRMELPELDFRIECTKGTYIRSIARDLGLLLEMGACLTSLRRTRIGEYRVENAQTVDQFVNPKPIG
jgi:tRNA pseudouridine55 synthase